jgi:SAM-dependent methyltransferase
MSVYSLTQSQAHALLLQRTGYQSPLVAVLKKAGFAGWYDSRRAARTTAKHRAALGARYREECVREAQSLAAVLPERGTVMDIGCGLAGPDLALFEIRPELSFVLVDRDEFDDRPHYGYTEDASAYNSLSQTKDFLVANGLPAERVSTVDVTTSGFPEDARVDAVISIMSWGFHYPLATYLSQVHAVLNPGGVVVVDVRDGTDGEAELTEVFGSDAVRQVASPHTAFRRLLATKAG